MYKTLHNLHYEQIDKEVKCIEDELPFEIPDSWKWIKLGYISTYEQTKAKIKSSQADPNIWELNLEDIEKGGQLLQKKSVQECKSKGDKTIFHIGDILYSKLRPYLLKIIIADEDGICTSEIVPFRLYGNIYSKYIVYTLKSPFVDSYINSVTYGVKMPRAGTDTMINLYLPLPPLSEQHRIVAKLQELEPLIEKYRIAEEQLHELNSNIKEQLKKSILQYAIEGKLVPQDPNDEPASVLLERIRKEKEKLIVEGKIKKDKNESIIYRRDNSYYEKLGKQDNEITDEITINIPNGWSISRLKDLVEISTGKKDANYSSETGKYDFFTCANTPIKTDDYSYSGEYLIMPGNGANIGNVIYYNGKFEAYQRTYLLRNIYSINLKWMKYHLESNWKEYNSDKMYGSAIPYIKLSNLENYLVYIPPLAEQNKIIEFLNTTNAVLEKL